MRAQEESLTMHSDTDSVFVGGLWDILCNLDGTEPKITLKTEN